MTASSAKPTYDAIVGTVEEYLDALYLSDTDRLAKVFHPKAIYASASDGALLHLTMDDYFEVVRKRPSPASPHPINGDIVSIDLAGPVTAVVRVTCEILPKLFTDILTLIEVDGRWRIVSKVFHYDLAEPAA